MGAGTGRSNKLTSDSRPPRQTALQQPPAVTTRLTILNEGSQWSWTLEHYGKTYTSGIARASGPATFGDPSHAAEFAVANYVVVRTLRHDERPTRSRWRAARDAPGAGTKA